MATRIPPNIKSVLPKEIPKTVGQVNTIQSQAKSLKTSVKNIHNINDAIGAAKEAAAFAKSLGLIKKEKPSTDTGEVKRQPRASTFSLSTFVSEITSKGLAKSNKFKVKIYHPNVDELRSAFGTGQSLSYYCEAAEFPGRTLEFTDAVMYGPSYKMPYASNYQEITLTLLCDQELQQKRIIDKWMDYINPINSFDFSFRDDYTTFIDISQYNEMGDQMYCCRLMEAYPVSVQPLTVSWADDQFQKVQVTMCYRYWETVDVPAPANQERVLEQRKPAAYELEEVVVTGEQRRSLYDRINDGIRNAKKGISAIADKLSITTD